MPANTIRTYETVQGLTNIVKIPEADGMHMMCLAIDSTESLSRGVLGHQKSPLRSGNATLPGESKHGVADGYKDDHTQEHPHQDRAETRPCAT